MYKVGHFTQQIMTLLKACLGLVLFISLAGSVNSFIVRHRDCHFFANFTRMRGKYFSSGVARITLNRNISYENCSFKCTADKRCFLFNHRQDNTSCELIMGVRGKFKENPKWQVGLTNYADPFYQGRYCQKIKPHCADMHYCIDHCENGYQCIKWEKVTIVRTNGPSTNEGRAKVYDGNLLSFIDIPKKNSYWIQLDAVYTVTFFRIKCSRIDHAWVSGTSGYSCIDLKLPSGSDISKKYQCLNGVMTLSTMAIVGRTNQNFILYEWEIYGHKRLF